MGICESHLNAHSQQEELLPPQNEFVQQGLLFPLEVSGTTTFTGDDVLLLELYQQIEQLGLPIALPALIRFHRTING